MNHKKFWQGWEQITYGILGGIALYCLIVTATSYWEMGGLDKRSVDEGVIVSGIVEYVPKGRYIPDVGIRKSGGKRWRCSVIYCSYEGIRQDYGKVVEAIVLEGQVVQIRINNEIKLTKGTWEAAHIRSDLAVAGLFLCLVIALIRFSANRSA